MLGVLTIAATYFAFLLFAQFGFLSQLQRDLGDAGRVRAAMAAMGTAGLAASLGTAWLLGRVPGLRLIRTGLASVAGVAALSLVCHGFAVLLGIAAAIGAAMGLLTVAVAASLPEIAPPGWLGKVAGLGTGIAYLLSNVPALFEGAPAARALAPAGLALAALAFGRKNERGARGVRASEGRTPEDHGLLPLLLTFLVLIWLDSAAFAIVQANPALKAATWGGAGRQALQGSVHFLAAVGAGALLDAGFGIAVPLAAWGLFAVAFPLLQQGGVGAGLAGPIYAVGISLYSTALVVMPSFNAGGSSPPVRWRAGLLYGVAGWIGSALGVGMAQDLGRIPGWFLIATGAALALTWLRPSRGSLRRAARLYGPALALGAAGVVGLWVQSAMAPAAEGSSQAERVARGRRVYIEEGCIHCHSQYVRPGTRDVAWWGPARAMDREERPVLAGARRQGPDLLAIGNRRSLAWNEWHLKDPRSLNPGSRMPSYAYLFDDGRGRDLVAYLNSLGEGTEEERKALIPPETPAPGSTARGRTLFLNLCAPCHGASARGDGPLALHLADPYADLRRAGFHNVRADEPLEPALARIVRYGLAPTSMPGHEWLTDRQVADLVAYVKTLKEAR
ncbi:MAG: cbb3-type cytochrome c oxidase subunit II [Thermoanaerobaculia bacterium]